jgi:hypothetical protein
MNVELVSFFTIIIIMISKQNCLGLGVWWLVGCSQVEICD